MPRVLEHELDVVDVVGRVERGGQAGLGKEGLGLVDHKLGLALEPGVALAGRGGLFGRVCGNLLVLELDLVGGNVVKHVLEELAGEGLAVVDPAVVGDKLVEGHLFLDLVRVEVGVEHDGGKRQDIHRVGVGKHALVGGHVPLGKLEHHPVDLLGLARETKAGEKQAERVHKGDVGKVQLVDPGVHDGHVKVIRVAQVRPDLVQAEARRRLEERRHCGRLFLHRAGLDQVGDPLARLEVELLDSRLEHLLGLFLGLKHGGRRGGGRFCRHERRRGRVGAGRRRARSRRCPAVLVSCPVVASVLGILGCGCGGRGLGVGNPQGHRVEDGHEGLEGLELHGRLLLEVGGRGRACGCQMALCDAREVVDDGLKDVHPVEVAVVVEKQVDQGLGLLAERAERLEDHPLLVRGGVGRLEDAEKEVCEKHADLDLEVVLKVREEDDKEREGESKDLGDGGDAVLEQRCAAQVLLDGRDKLFVRAKGAAPRVEDKEEELEGEDLGPHVDRVDRVGPAGVRRLFHRELAERTKDEKGVLLRDRRRLERGRNGRGRRVLWRDRREDGRVDGRDRERARRRGRRSSVWRWSRMMLGLGGFREGADVDVTAGDRAERLGCLLGKVVGRGAAHGAVPVLSRRRDGGCGGHGGGGGRRSC